MFIFIINLIIDHSDCCNSFQTIFSVLSDIFNNFDKFRNYLFKIYLISIIKSQKVCSLLPVEIFPDVHFEVSASNNKLDYFSMSYLVIFICSLVSEFNILKGSYWHPNFLKIVSFLIFLASVFMLISERLILASTFDFFFTPSFFIIDQENFLYI